MNYSLFITNYSFENAMPQEPNIYELNANVKNLVKKIDELSDAAEKRGAIQTDILTKIAEQKKVSDYIFFRLSALEETSKKTSAFMLKCTGALAVLTPLAGYILSKLF